MNNEYEDMIDEYNDLLDELGVTDEEIMRLAMMLDDELSANLPISMGLPDWTYKDLPRMTSSVKDEFNTLVGDDNIKWVTYASYEDGSVRGQVILSPTAMAIIEQMAVGPVIN